MYECVVEFICLVKDLMASAFFHPTYEEFPRYYEPPGSERAELSKELKRSGSNKKNQSTMVYFYHRLAGDEEMPCHMKPEAFDSVGGDERVQWDSPGEYHQGIDNLKLAAVPKGMAIRVLASNPSEWLLGLDHESDTVEVLVPKDDDVTKLTGAASRLRDQLTKLLQRLSPLNDKPGASMHVCVRTCVRVRVPN